MALESFNHNLIKIIECPTEELNFLSFSDKDMFLNLYKNILLLYLKRSNFELQELLQKISVTTDLSAMEKLFLQSVAEMRLCLATGVVSEEHTLKWTADFNNEILQAEYNFVKGLCCEKVKLYEQGMNSYLLAEQLFEKNKCPNKSLIAAHNRITCLSKRFPDQKFISEYNYLAKKAKQTKNHTVLGMALYNISSELQILGSVSSALKYANKSLTVLKMEFGTYHYEMCLMHRCHLLLNLKMYIAANEDYLVLKKSKHSEVQSGLLAIEKIITNNQSLQLTQKELLHPTWLDRLSQNNNQELLTPDEEKLILLLCENPKSKENLIKSLYGERLDFESGQNRLKNLLFRFKKKRPGILLIEENILRLAV
ncbi:MAG: hypothetical protein ACOYOK_12915 [Pseudobdellovibrionaceae bacterium]